MKCRKRTSRIEELLVADNVVQAICYVVCSVAVAFKGRCSYRHCPNRRIEQGVSRSNGELSKQKKRTEMMSHRRDRAFQWTSPGSAPPFRPRQHQQTAAQDTRALPQILDAT